MEPVGREPCVTLQRFPEFINHDGEENEYDDRVHTTHTKNGEKLEKRWGIKLMNRARGSTGGHQKYKAGIFTRKLALRGSDCVREAFEEVLDLCEAGGVDFEDLEELPEVKDYRDKGKTSLKRPVTDIGQPQAAAGSSVPPPTPAGGSEALPHSSPELPLLK